MKSEIRIAKHRQISQENNLPGEIASTNWTLSTSALESSKVTTHINI